MQDPRKANATPRDPATPPPLPPRSEPRVEPRPEPRVEPRVEPRSEPRIELRIEPVADDAAGDHKVPTYLALPKRQAVYFGVAGFVAGIVFWHAVGFWTVVQNTVYQGTDDRLSNVADAQPTNKSSGTFADAIDRAISQATPPSEATPITTGAISLEKNAERLGGNEGQATAPGQTNCASFTRDRATGEILSRPCTEAERSLPHNPEGTRENLAVEQARAPTGTGSRWSTYTAPKN
ncbi:hypothetical protein SAMN04488061_1552 [Filomicrobium insigne]|uniref:Uncharacterized protein n=1 Tax=Filomicrobium insigne TaxID=418854 RepID=A0A1H0M2T7_9HYPH|nr:hypothetical protein [Filomicrobium insigne]SDO74723.1 hypothetical protein SAMN04488061_1552 [Filomicrobium insigne]